MSRFTARLVHLAVFLVTASGAIWAWMRYVYNPGPEPEDPELLLAWSGAHAGEPSMRTLHLLTAPLLVFAVALIWRGHVAPRFKKPWPRRTTGLLLTLLFAPMVVSGVLLQTAPSPEQRSLWVWVHGLSSAAWALAYIFHQLAPRGKRIRAQDA